MGINVVLPPQPPKFSSGAGRFIDFLWPDYASLASTNVAGRSRIAGTSSAAPGQTGTATRATSIPQGTDCYKFIGNGADETLWGALVFFQFHIRTDPSDIPPTLDPYGVQRICAVMQFDDPTTTRLRDSGLEVTANTTFNGGGSGSRIMNDTTPSQADPGFGIVCKGPGIMSFVARLHNQTLFSKDLTAPPFLTSNLHHYELRITSATQTAYGKVQVYIDGTLFYEVSWGAGSPLPISETTFAPGYRWSVNGPDTKGSNRIAWARFIAGPSLDDVDGA